MKFQDFLRAVASVFVTVATLAGCAAPEAWDNAPLEPGGSLTPEARTPGHQLIYVSDDTASDVLIFPQKGTFQYPIGFITTGIDDPWGLYVDKHHALYVANQGNSTVTVYPAGSTSPSMTFSQDLFRPLYPVVDRSGDLFVGNGGNSYGSGGTVVEYPPGSTTPSRVLQTPGSEVDGMDFDGEGNLYVAYRAASGTGSIEKLAPGSSRGTFLGMLLSSPQGLVVDNAGNILVVESGWDRVDVFPPGQVKPSVEVTISAGPNQIAIKQNETSVFVADENGTVYGSRYPFRKRPRVYPKDEVNATIQGVALSEGQTF